MIYGELQFEFNRIGKCKIERFNKKKNGNDEIKNIKTNDKGKRIRIKAYI